MNTSERPYEWRTDLPQPSDELPELLLDWYAGCGRDFPRRHTTNPFHVLCAELMLQRTRASQVAPVFEEFRNRFGGPAEVVAAGRDVVNALFDSLGLHWRAEYFWQLQLRLVRDREGQVPNDLSELLALPGVGRYAATATAVFAFGARATVVDSNVLRIFGRWYGIKFPNHARRSPRVAQWAARHAPESGERVRKVESVRLCVGTGKS